MSERKSLREMLADPNSSRWAVLASYLTVNAYWFGLTTISQSNGLIYPLLVQRFVGEETKATFFGTLRLWTLMVALLVQALMGMLSDRSTLRWGRRRPFILAGTLMNLACITAVGLSADLDGMTGYWVLFGIVILQQFASNVAHGAEQGLIPDLVPEEKRGRFSGVKAVFELLPVIAVAFLVAPMVEQGSLWGALLVTMAILALVTALTMVVREERLREPPSALDWTPFLRLLLMTGIFTLVILGMGESVKLIGRLAEGIESPTALLLIMGSVGLVAMAAAVGIGVWISVRASIGSGASRSSSFSWWVINRLAFLVGVNNLSTFAVYFIQGRLGYAEEEAAGPAGRLMMIVGLLILLTALPSGWLSDRFGRKRLIAISGGVAALGTFLLLLTTNMLVIYIGGCLIGAATGLFFTSNWAFGTSLVPKEEAGRYLGISNLAGAGAGAVGGYIGGPIADYITLHVPQIPGAGYVVLFAIYGVLFLFSIWTLTRIKESPAQE